MPDVASPPAAAPAPSPNAAPAAKPAAVAPAPKPAAQVKTPVPVKAPTVEPKVKSPFEEADEAMARFSDPDQDEPKPPGAAKPPAKPQAKPETKPDKKTEDPESEESSETAEKEGETATPEEKSAADEKPGKTSPWKLVESYKKTNTQLQKEIAELRSSVKPGELPKEFQEKFSSIEARNKELEDEIRHVNYSMSKEFQETYQKPYEEAWKSAIDDLKELTITNDDGSSRQASVQDLMALANMPLGQARATAKAWFGDSADDVMSHRRTLRDLSDKQTKALEDSKKMGSEREQQRNSEMQAKHKARAEESAKVWAAVNAEAVEKYEYLRPIEGETERNEKLEKATKFVDETFKSNVNQAKTQEERDQIIRAHAALRNRAIGFSVFKHENVSLKAKVAELEKALAEYQGSEPAGGKPKSPQNGEVAGDEMGAAMGRMANYVT